MPSRRLPSAITIARVAAVEIAVHWRWAAALVLSTLLLGSVLPGRFPDWDAPTLWLTSAAAVLAGELMLLLHELSHAFAARGRGQEVQRIVFHGFLAETVVSGGPAAAPGHEMLIALVGPGMNVALASGLAALRLALPFDSPASLVALLLVLANATMATASLLPVGPSDGQRALAAFRRARAESDQRSAVSSWRGNQPTRLSADV